MPDNNIETTLGELAARHAAPLAAKLHNDRSAALASAREAIDTACARERSTLQDKLAVLQVRRETELSAADASAEQTRLARAAALLKETHARGPDTLFALMSEFSREPSRVTAMKIRTMWDAFNARAVNELGSALAAHALAQVVCDVVLARDGFAGAINATSDLQFGTSDALYLAAAFTTASTPQTIENALIECEGRMVSAVQRWLAHHPDARPEPEYVARHAVRRATATHGDWTREIAALDAVQGAARDAEFARTYVAPERDGAWAAVRRTFGLGAD